MATNPPSPPSAARESAPLPGVVLVAHGSSRSGASAEPVLALARELVRRGFAEVRTAFWKEEPFLHQALDGTRSAQLVVLPVFLAEGYFARVVVPRELGLRYGDNPLGRRSARLLPPLGADPALDALVLERAREALPAGARPSDAALIVLGHGTPRDPGSADAVLAVCARLRQSSGFGRVVPAFLDQDPRLDQVVAEQPERATVVVPFLVAAGFHGGALGGETERPVSYAEPVGTHPALVDVVERILRAAAVHETPATGSEAAPLVGLEPALHERITRAGRLTVLQVEIRALPAGEYTLRHVRDVDADDASLVDVTGLDALSALARRSASGAHRPLRTAADLPGGWRHRARGRRALVEALVALYGPAVAHWHMAERGQLAVSELADVAARQSGIYEQLRHVEPAAITEGIRRVCDGLPCLRARLWGPASSRTSENTQGAGLVVPCPAPCPILLGALLEVPETSSSA